MKKTEAMAKKEAGKDGETLHVCYYIMPNMSQYTTRLHLFLKKLTQGTVKGNFNTMSNKNPNNIQFLYSANHIIWCPYALPKSIGNNYPSFAF